MRSHEDELAGRVRSLEDARADARALRTARNGWRGSRRSLSLGVKLTDEALCAHAALPAQRIFDHLDNDLDPPATSPELSQAYDPACNAAQPPFACRVLYCEHYGIYYHVDETDRAVTVFAIEDQRRNPLTRFESYEYAVEAPPSRCDQPRS